MDANSLLQLILLTIALGALVYCLIQARGARDICNKLMKDIKQRKRSKNRWCIYQGSALNPIQRPPTPSFYRKNIVIMRFYRCLTI